MNGLKETRTGGLTEIGCTAVERMNKLGILIDCSHIGDQTALDMIAHSNKPILRTHFGVKALWDTNPMARRMSSKHVRIKVAL